MIQVEPQNGGGRSACQCLKASNGQTCCVTRSSKDEACSAACRWKTEGSSEALPDSAGCRRGPSGVCATEASESGCLSSPPLLACFVCRLVGGDWRRADRGTAPKGFVSRRGLGLGGWEMVVLSGLLRLRGCNCMRERRASLFSATKRGVPPALTHHYS